MNKKKISVIIPAYNVENYIRQCLDSVLKQKYRNIEVLIIDDGSSDETGNICDEYSKLDYRIKVIHKKNEGVSSARNRGLELATGEYISFVDADDTVEYSVYSKCINDFNTSDADVVVFLSNLIDEYGEKKNLTRKQVYENMEQVEAIRHLVNGDKFGCACYSKIFSRNIIDGIRFNTKLSVNEDFLFCFYCFSRARKIIFNGEYLYNYRKRKGSITSEPFNKKKFDCIKAAREMHKFCSLYRTDLEALSFKRLIRALLATFNKALFLSEYENELMEIANELKYKRFIIYTNKELSMKDKIAVFLISHNKGFYQKMYSIIKRAKVKNE